MAKKLKSGKNNNSIILNKKARYDFHIDDVYEAGISLLGWEVKSIRQKKIQITDSYVLLKDGEAWLVGALITPLDTVSTHFVADPKRDRKLLLNRKEIAKIFSVIQQKGSACVATKLYWKKYLVKCQIALAKGKKEFDKRATNKEREWNIEKQRLFRHSR